jgi:hypothetical protein
MRIFGNFGQAIHKLQEQMKSFGQPVHTEKWQGMDISKMPEMSTFEMLNVSFQVPMSEDESIDRTLKNWRNDIRPNTPWADDHFLERIGRQPLNPGVQWANWPYSKSADRFRDINQQFTHTYMERIWPKFAGHTDGGLIDARFTGTNETANRGYRYRYGDLDDVVALLSREPQTRQAFLPLWFPEDTGVVHGGRVPCTLGYHFIMRGNFLHVVYWLRSCDMVRHFRDDIYLALRLTQWVLNELRKQDPITWNPIKLGMYTMHMTSFHIFVNDYRTLYGKGSK